MKRAVQFRFHRCESKALVVQNVCLTISRFAISAWVGAACLFIVITLQDVRSTALDSATKAAMAVQRFPVYYTFAFGLLATTCLFAACGFRPASKLRRRLTMLLLLLPLLLTTVDYIWIYKPLETMTALAEQARPARFIDLHKASKWINTVQVSMSLFAALAICWPATSLGPMSKVD